MAKVSWSKEQDSVRILDLYYRDRNLQTVDVLIANKP